AEDDPNIRNLLAVLLTGRGHNVHAAGDGREALGLVEKIKPSLLITDVMMPHMNGYQLVHTITSERYDLPTPKIIILTSRTDSADVARGLKVGADMYIPKPFDIMDVADRVQELLSGAPAGENKKKD
ncbi:MAG: response regulator, partial [Elusimicrobia bacterium]|nr:response regulator [Elusimicrobiota bacterium]